MRLVGLMIVRNEEDILEVNVLYHLHAGVDEVVVVDNGSSDKTPAILERLAKGGRVRWTSNRGPYLQAEITTELAREAFREGADWVLPIDADEFWYAPSGDFRGVLEQTSAAVLEVEVVNYIQRRGQISRSPKALLGMIRRTPVPWGPLGAEMDLVESGRCSYVEGSYRPKCISRTSGEISIEMGNHDVSGLEGQREKTTGILCLHAPLRSRDLLEMKMRDHGARVEQLGLGPRDWWQARRWSRLWNEGRLEEEWKANSYAGGSLDVGGERHPVIFDPTLRNLVRPWVDKAKVTGSATRKRNVASPVWGRSRALRLENEALVESVQQSLLGHLAESKRTTATFVSGLNARDEAIRSLEETVSGLSAVLKSREEAERQRLEAEGRRRQAEESLRASEAKRDKADRQREDAEMKLRLAEQRAREADAARQEAERALDLEARALEVSLQKIESLEKLASQREADIEAVRTDAAAARSELGRRASDLELIRASQEVRLARLGSTLAETLRAADRNERQLEAALARSDDLDARLQEARNQVVSQQWAISFMESTRAWRTRGRILRARQRLESAFGGAGTASRTSEGLQSAVASASDPNFRPLPENPNTDTDTEAAKGTTSGVSVSRGLAAPQSVLFVSHDAHPHGAQILLLRFLQWLRRSADLEFEILLAGDGALRGEFESVARVSQWHDGTAGLTPLPEADPLMRRFHGANIGLVYSNTIANGRVLAGISGLRRPVMTHVHELGFWAKNRVRPEELRIVLEASDRFIACSGAVRNSLVESLAVAPDKVSVVHGFVPTEDRAYVHLATPEQVREELGIPASAHIVGASGTTDWRKGSDLFVQLARAVRPRVTTAPVHFVWIGGRNEGPEIAELRHDVKKACLEGTVHFIGHRPNPRDYFAACDVFALTSREDPFPLVNLEAATAGVPTVCFDGAGGAREFVETDCGFVVPYLDVNAMAERVAEILTSPKLRERLGQCAAWKVRQRHDIEVAAPLLLKEIRSRLPKETSVTAG